MKHYRTILYFFMCRIYAPAAIVIGTILVLTSVHALLPGGTIDYNGVPSHDIVLRIVAVVFPLAIAVTGIALYRAKPAGPE